MLVWSRGCWPRHLRGMDVLDFRPRSLPLIKEKLKCRPIRSINLRGQDRAIDLSHARNGDFWQPTHEGLTVLFGDAGFHRVDIFPIDGRVISRLQLLGLFPLAAKIPRVQQLIPRFDRPRLGRTTSLHFVRAEKSG